MGISSKQVGWSNESNLLYNIIKQLKFLTEVASKNTGGTGGGASISDAIYSVSWNADTSQGASRNALYDKFTLIDAAISNLQNPDLSNYAQLNINNTWTGYNSFNNTASFLVPNSSNSAISASSGSILSTAAVIAAGTETNGSTMFGVRTERQNGIGYIFEMIQPGATGNIPFLVRDSISFGGDVKFQVDQSGNLSSKTLKILTTPTTSTGNYSILTRNNTTGIIEKISSTPNEVLINGFFVETFGKTNLTAWEVNDVFRGWVDSKTRYVVGKIISITGLTMPNDIDDNTKVLLAVNNNL